VRPRNADDVQYAVKHAKDLGVSITVKNGGHSFCGSSTAKEGILMDLKRLNNVSIDLDSLRATVQAGTVWGQVYKQLSILKSRGDGYILNGGRCPAVGVSGFILGGGLGPFTRSFGMGCDTVIDFTLVTADGSILTVSRNDDPDSPKGQLFWALCGAGHGNFGIIVEITMDVCKLQNPDKAVSASLFTWYPHQEPNSLSMDGLIDLMNKFYTHEWTYQMIIDSTWLVDHRRTPEIGIRWTLTTMEIDPLSRPR
jgi:FAD/FMN-containing dehydrogenase